MKKEMLILATVAAAVMGAFADTVDPTMNQFYFESKDGAGVSIKSEWGVSVKPGASTKSSGTTTFSSILKPYTTVEDWGLSDTADIAKAVWQGVASTNFTYTHTTGLGTKYLYMFVRYFRYNLTLDAGTGDPSSYVTNNICYTNSIALPTPTRTGYDFLGWTNSTLAAALTGEQTGAELQVQEDDETVVLYAKWEPKTFTVTFDPNGEGATVDPTETTATYDSVYDTLPTPVWADHGFVGWFTDATDGELVTNETVVAIVENQTLYAHWAELYTVSFKSESGSTYDTYADLVYGTNIAPPDISLKIPPGSRLQGWEYGSKVYAPDELIPVTQSMTLVAKFDIIQTQITYSCDPNDAGRIDCTGDAYGTRGRTVTLVANANAAYEFDHWSDDTTSGTKNVTVNSDTNLVAYFRAKSVAVNFFDFDGVTPLDPPSVEVEYGHSAEAIAPAAPIHAGLTFTGWSEPITNVIADMNVSAQYSTNRYTVVYDANGGEGSMTNEVFTYGMQYQLQSNVYTRALNQFFGWATTPGAATNEVEYLDGATVSNLTPVANGTNTLYAVWSSRLSDLSVAANCTNLILVSSNGGWGVDNDVGFESPSSAHISGTAISRITTMIDGVGTLTFRVKSIRAASGPDVFDFFEVGAEDKRIAVDDTAGNWVLYAHDKVDQAVCTWTWRYVGNNDSDCYWVDQVHWYPGKSVTVPGNNIDSSVKNEVTEAILQNWDMILGLHATSVSTAVATGADVTNAVALLANRIMPDVAIHGDTAELTFKNDGEVWKEPVTVPSIESVAYTGEPLTATVPDSEQYAIVSNEGGTTAGVYSVVLELTDTDRYRWAEGDSNPTSLTFTITQAVNEWVVEPSMAGWTSGETPSEPNLGEAKFGSVVVTYGVSGTERPSEPGEYEATFTVDETDNYSGLTKAVSFTIVSAGEASAMEKAFDGLPVTVEFVGAGGWKVTFTNDIDTAALPITLPDNLGTVVIDLNGHDLLGGEGQPALRIAKGEGEGAPTVLTINGSGATVRGGEGQPAIVAADGTQDGVTVNVGAGVTLEGGGVPAIDGAEIGTNEGNITKVDVLVPTVADKEYTGQWQTADIAATDLYTVQNEGGTNVGVYTVTLTLSDTNCYCWAGGDSNPTSLTFTITRATNEWKVEPSMAGWTSGETPSEPNLGEAKFGTVAVTYGASGAERPSEPGKYEATFTVDETDNYSGLTKVVPFTISGSSDPISSDLSTWPHDGAYNPLVANVYDGFLLDADGLLSGIIQVKAAKQAVKTTTDRVTKEKTVTTNVAITATVTDANGKKWSYSKGVGTVEGVVTGLVCTTKDVLVPAFGVTLGANGLSGVWGDLAIVGARNGMGTKNDAMLAELEAHYKKSWSVTFTNELGATRLQLVVGAKGSTKISGTTADGFKVSATVQGVLGEAAFFVPYRATLKSGKLSRTVCLLLALKRDGSVESLASDLGALKSGGPTTDALEVQPYEESALSKGGEAYAGAVVLNDLAYPAKFAAKGLPAGLKIDAATGAITGTPTKPGHYVATITITSGINAKAKTETVVEFDIANFTDGKIPVADAYGPYRVGVKVFESINDALGYTVSGLPAGLKFAAKETKDATFGVVPAGTIYGVPTKAATNTVYFKKSTKETVQGKTVTVNHQASATFPVDPLSTWAQGTFDGAVDLGVASPSGLVTFTVSAAGKVSGKWQEDGLTWTLAAAAYDSYDAGTDEYVATFVGKSGKLAFTNEVIVSAEALGDSARGVATGDGLAAWQNLWKTEPWKTRAKPFANKTLVLSGVKDGLPMDGDSMTLKFAATGAVTAKFGTYSCSSVLIPDDGEGHYYRLFLYFPPKSGKFDGYTAEVPLVWDGSQFSISE